MRATFTAIPQLGRQGGRVFLASLASLRENRKRAVMTENAIARQIVDAAFRIQTILGPVAQEFESALIAGIGLRCRPDL